MILVILTREDSTVIAGGYHSKMLVIGHATYRPDDVEGLKVCAAVSTICMTLSALLPEEVPTLLGGRFEWVGEESPFIDFALKSFELLAENYSDHLSLTIR